MTAETRESQTIEESIEDQAATWFERKQFWNWTGEDESALAAWLATSPANEIAYWRLEAGWKRSERMAALKRPRLSSRFSSSLGAKRVFRVASTIFAVAVIALAISVPDRQRETAYSTAIGERRTVLLSDGSRIELNTGSALRVFVRANARQAILVRGEAYFTIKHDPSRPFVVLAAGRRVTDLGTKFLLRLDNDQRLVMELTEGRAQLDATTSDSIHRQAMLEPGDIAVATHATLQLHRLTPSHLLRELSWREDKLIFDNTKLADVVAQFNRYNTQKLRVDDAAVAARTISGTFRTTNTADFASLAREVLGLRIQRKDGVILIKQ